jgi:hypothetical protein
MQHQIAITIAKNLDLIGIQSKFLRNTNSLAVAIHEDAGLGDLHD